MMKKLLGGYSVLLIYFLGIGFISGSIVHFTLNPWRFGLIGLVGGVLFAIATYIQDFWGYEDSDTTWSHILYRVLTGVFLSIGLGMISGSIQHFNEITYEALWYIPIGTALSLTARRLQEKDLRQGVSLLGRGGVVVGGTLLSILISGYVQMTMYPDGPVGGHHGEGTDHHGGGYDDSGHIHDESHAHDSQSLGAGSLSVKSRDEYSEAQKMNIHLCLMGGGENCETILDPENRSDYADALQEQCDLMPGMSACDQYFDTTTQVITNPYDLIVREGAIEATVPEIVQLQDGDSYEIIVQDVVKTINGTPIRMLAYNGSIPGPVLKAEPGSTVTLTLTNQVNDITTTMHHHGLRHSERYDGVPVDMGGYDVPIAQGESLKYVIEFPDSGVFWYHPHVREDFQQEMGLYGNYLIQSAQEKAELATQVNSEHLIMLDDIFLDDQGQMVPFDQEMGTHVVMGRFGNTPLVNGDTQYTLRLSQGEVTRLYLTNVANVTPFNITIPGVQMKLVGGDIGKYEREEMIERLVVSPAERYIIDIYAPETGEYTIINSINEGSYELGTILVSKNEAKPSYSEQFGELKSNEGVIADIDQYRQYFDQPIDKTLRLDVEMDGMTGPMDHGDDHGHGGHAHDDEIALPGGLMLDPSTIEWTDEMPEMNQVSTTNNTRWYLVDEDTDERNMDVRWTFTQGDKVKIRIFNDPDSVHPMQHPIHFHGQRFLVLNKNGEENQNLVRKDTVLVPTGEYVDILLDASNPGTRMVHCHIAEHLTAGMMMKFEVVEG